MREDGVLENLRLCEISRAGWIKQVVLTNFMCHSYAKVDFVKQVNFITGQNGSGKSSILTALCVAFGTNARNTQRASNLKDFIKSGESFAVVEVTLSNVGEDAFKEDVYGDSIVVERRLSVGGASSFGVKDSSGKKISGKRDDVEEIATHFLIEVDNPCLIMTQDKSREFLHSGSEKDKFKFFVKATLLERVIQLLSEVQSGIKLGVDLLSQLKGDVKPLEARITNLKEQASELQELQSMQERIDHLKKLLAWSFVEKDREAFQEANSAVDSIMSRINECDRMMQQAKAAMADHETRVAESQAALKMGSGKQDALLKKQAELQEQATEAARKRKRAQMEHEGKLKNLQQCQFQAEEFRELIRKNEEQAKQDCQAEELVRKSNIELKEIELQSALHDSEGTAKKLQDVEAETTDIATRKRHIQQEMQENDRRQRDCRGWIQRLEEQQRNSSSVDRFGGRGVLKLLRVIEENIHRFQCPPIGPIGAHLNLLDDKYALAIEVAIGRNLDSFVVSSMDDNKLLQRLSREAGFRCTSVVYNFSLPPICPHPDQVPPPELVTVESVLSVGSQVVRNVLIDLSAMERTVLVRDYDEGKGVAFQAGNNIKECIDLDGLRMFMREGQECMVKRPHSLHSGRLKRDVMDDLRDATAEAQQLEEEGRRQRASMDSMQAELREAEGRRRQLQKEAERTEVAINSLKREVEALVAANRNAQGVSAEPSAEEYEAQIKDLEREMAELQTSITALASTLQLAEQHEVRCREELRVASDDAKECFTMLDSMESLHVGLEKAARERVKEEEHYSQLKEQAECELKAVQELVSSLLVKLQECTRKASLYCPEPSAQDWTDLPRSTALLQKRIGDMQRKKDEKQSTAGAESLDSIQRLLSKLERSKDKRKEQVAVLEDRFQKLKDVLKERRKGLKTAMECLRRDVNWKFNERLHRKGARGKISIDFQGQTLSMEIHLPSDKSGSAVKDTRALSGGERSFSTLCYALALHDMADAPFRAMDEFDVFMDNVTRKVCLEEAVKFAVQSGAQWVFITPHDISSVEATAQVKKQEMPAPRN